MKIYNLGSLNIDYVYNVEHFVSAGETLSSESLSVFPGGKGLNQSVAAAKAGAKVIHGAIIGNNGDFLLDTLTASGVDISRIEKADKSCGHAIIQVDKNGQNCILLYAGTNHLIDKKYIEKFLSDAEENDILLIQNETNCLDIALEMAHSKGMQIAFNPSPFHNDIKKLTLSYVKYWFCNEIEGEELFGSSDPKEIAKAFVNNYENSNLILTLGKNGSVFINNDSYIEQPIYEVKAIDTTAAGDTFTGFFLAALIEDKGIEFAMKSASKASSISVSRMGASSSIPTRDEVYDEI